MNLPAATRQSPQPRVARRAGASEDWLGETRQLDLSDPKLRITALKLTQAKQSLPARAAAIQDFVRRMPFAASELVK